MKYREKEMIGRPLYDAFEGKYGVSFYGFTETDFKYIEIFENKYPEAKYVIVDNDYNLVQIFKEYRDVCLYRKIYNQNNIKKLSLFHNYFIHSYFEHEKKNWKSPDFISRFREDYDKTPDQRYLDYVTKD